MAKDTPGISEKEMKKLAREEELARQEALERKEALALQKKIELRAAMTPKELEMEREFALASMEQRIENDKLRKLRELRKKEQGEELAKIIKDSPVEKTTKSLVEDSLRDKVVATQDQYEQKGQKTAGVSAGYVATEKATGETFILKQFFLKNSDCKSAQDRNNREDGVRELVGSTMYQFLLYDRAPKEQLVKSSEVPPKSLYVRSKFFKETQQLSVFSGGDEKGRFNRGNTELLKIKGFEKVVAACHMLGELDYHAGNMMVDKDNTVVKIDHGRSFMTFYKDFSSMIVATNNKFIKEFGYNEAINFGTLNFDIKKYSASLKQMVSQLSEEQIDAIVDQKIDALKKAGFDPKDLQLYSKFDNFDNMKDFPKQTPNSFEDLGKIFKDNIKQNLSNMKEIANQVEIIAKFGDVSQDAYASRAFRDGEWVQSFAESAEKDPIKYAIKNNIKIDGLDPKDYALNSILDQYTKADGIKAKELEAKYLDVLKDLSPDKSYDKSDKNIKHIMLESLIDQHLKITDPAIQKELEAKYIALQKLGGIETKNIKHPAIESLIEQYLKTADPAIQKELEVKYIALQKLGEKQAPELLSIDSNFGKFLNNPKAADIMANHKDFKGKPITATIDYMKCDLPLIAKCKEVHEKTGKARDYDTLSTKQKVGMAFATVVPIIGNIIAYYAMKSHNKLEKTKLEKEIAQPLDGIKADLAKLHKKPPTISELDPVDISRLKQIKSNVNSNKEKSTTLSPHKKVEKSVSAHSIN